MACRVSVMVGCLAIGLCGVLPAWGASPIRLASNPAVSPDGNQVAFSWRGDIWLVATAGGTARQLTTHSADDTQPVFSPDGGRIAFISNRTGSNQVYVMSVSGGEPTQLTFHTEGYSLLEWYPDGQSLLTSGSRDHFWRHSERLFQVSLEPRTGEKLLFDAYGRDARIAPDGRSLLFTREGTPWWRKQYRGAQASQIWQYTLANGRFRKLVDHPAECRTPLWEPSGQRFYYVSGQSGAFNLWLRELATGEERPLTHFADDSVTFPAIARNGSVIVFRHLFDLYAMRPGSDEEPRKIEITYAGDDQREPTLRRTLRTATHATFTKDGLEVALIAGGDVWVMDTVLREPRQVTNTPEEVRDAVFSPDGQSLAFVSDQGGQSDIWVATRTQSDKFWWQNDTFTLQRLTEDADMESGLSWSPAGNLLAFVKSRGDLWVIKPDGSDARCLFASWNAPEYDWSPDGNWLAYALSDDDFNREIFIAPLDGSRPPYNVSMHPDNDFSPAWSPDGSLLAFTGRRDNDEVDIHYVYLQAEKDEESERDRKLQQAVEKIQKARKTPAQGPAAKPSEPAAAPTETPPKEATGTAPSNEQPADEPPKDEGDKKPDAAPPAVKPVRIDFDGLHQRVRRISIANSAERGLFWSHDSKQLAFVANVDGKEGTYSVTFPDELKPKLLVASTGSSARWLSAGNQIVWLLGGVPSSLAVPSGKAESYAFTVRQETDIAARYETVFMQCWRAMRDSFYDERLNNRDWNEVFGKYAPMAREAVDMSALAQVVSLMLGELNGSHLGFMPSRSGERGGESGAWRDTTAHLGLRFEAGHAGPGLKVRDVIWRGPADKAGSRVQSGEVLLSVDDVAVDGATDLTTLLNGSLDRDIRLKIRGEDGAERDVVIRPITYGAAREALYEMWVRRNRELVEVSSEGKLGYLHIRGMNMPSFHRFQQELYEVGFGKDGLVIDVRENGGGSTTDHLLTALTQPEHAITVPRGSSGRGYPHDRQVYATWNKPIVVLCNQNSFSNAEIFSHAIKTLRRGRLVGVPTSGSVISTGATSIMDVGTLRMPFRGWFTLRDGEDMELNGAVPHVVVWPLPGEMPAGKDRQLDRAVHVLKADVTRWQQRPQPRLRTAAEKRAAEATPPASDP